MAASKKRTPVENINLSDQASALFAAGWERRSVGQYRSNGSLKSYDSEFALYIRKTKLIDFLNAVDGHFSGKCPNHNVEKGDKHGIFAAGSNCCMGSPDAEMTPSLPALAHFDDYQSLRAIRTDEDSIVVAFDSEWFDNPRQMLTWQFAVIQGDSLVEFVFEKLGDRDLWLELALGRICDYLQLTSVDGRSFTTYEICTGFDDGKPITQTFDTYKDACQHAVYKYRLGKPVNERIEDYELSIPRKNRDWTVLKTIMDLDKVARNHMTLLCHAGKVDVSSLDQSSKANVNILERCQEVQGGLVTIEYPVKMVTKSVDPESVHGYKTRYYKLVMDIRDTMCHAPAGHKSLKALGAVVGVPKVELPSGVIEHMDQLLKDDPVLYFKYASNDSVVTLLYAAALYGYNKRIPVTITSVTACVMRKTMMCVLGALDTKSFDHRYRGLERVGKGKVPRKDGKPGYVEASSLDPISDKANKIQIYASKAYHGGYNSCSDVGFFSCLTYDYDLQNAYPTAMVMVPDIDWDNPVKYEIQDRHLTLDDWFVSGKGYNPLLPMFAYVRFKFPETVKYPSIPISVEGIPIFPRTSDGVHGVYAAGPEIYLALRLGATVYCEQGYVLNTLVINGKESYSLRSAVVQLVKDRKLAKAAHDQGSIEELILKTMVNSGYGKNAQNVIQKHSWSAYSQEMEDLGCSSITNPVSASLITSIVRAELIAAQNQAQAHERRYRTVSVTTDGFISDMPEDVLKSLDLYGFRSEMEKARLFLTDGKDPELWEIKHVQDDLVNFTTRGNVSLHDADITALQYSAQNPMQFHKKMYPGVCAHNSTKSGFASDTYEDRRWLMLSVLNRTGPVRYKEEVWTTFKGLVLGDPFTVTAEIRSVHMDFDMKRKPIRDSFVEQHHEIEGTAYEIAAFTTMPFENVSEYELYRKKKESCEVLRTMKDWKRFFFKVDSEGYGAKARDLDWSILNSAVMGHRAGFWQIPGLLVGTVQNKCDFINRHNKSSKQFKQNDWKNARRPERQATMLPQSMIQEKLDELRSATDYDSSEEEDDLQTIEE